MEFSSSTQTVIVAVAILATIMGIGGGVLACRHRRALRNEADTDKSTV